MRCWKCNTEANTRRVEDLSGNGEVYDLCEDCAEEMIESWDYETQQPKCDEVGQCH